MMIAGAMPPAAHIVNVLGVRKLTPETVAAVNGARPGGDEERPPVIFLQ